MMSSDKVVVYLFSFLLAFCSLFYELVYAQILSVCIGGTKTQYLITISLFTSALGLGSLLYNRYSKRMANRVLFFRIELLLTVMGSIGPFFITWLLQSKTELAFWTTTKIYISYGFIFMIGLLSGFELPCLFALLKDSHGKILAFDYMGMLAASILFPFLFLPYLGTAAGTLFVANLNVLALIWLMPNGGKIQSLFLSVSNLAVFVLILAYKSELNTILTSIYLGAK